MLRNEFGREKIIVGNFKDKKIKNAQSTNSKHLKFKSLICELCNTSLTQQADKEFDNVCQLALQKLTNGDNPASIFDLARYNLGTQEYLNIFRYFGKLLCCHMAEVGAPIPKMLAQFSIGKNSLNRIWLEIKADPTFSNAILAIGEHQYAAHGGLIVYADKITNAPNAFHSSLTIGPVQYVFHIRLNEFEQWELQKEYPEFYEWCSSKVEDSKKNPICAQEWLQVGLIAQDGIDG